MECMVCGLRSSVGYCAVCQKMLCEECGIRCEMCGKMVCSEHSYETSSGKQLCIECQKERKKEYAKRRREAEAGIQPQEDAVAQPEAVGQEEVLTASAKRKIEPWTWSLGVAILGVVIILVLLVVPSLRRAPLSASAYIPMSIVPIILALFATVWGILGIVREEHVEDRSKCFAGLGVAFVTILLAIVAIYTDPAAKIKSEVDLMQNDREGLSQKELTDWRKQSLEKFEK